MSGPLTFSPDPPHLLAGAGTAAEQSARPRMLADHVNGGWDAEVPPPPAATGATPGAPGTWTPAGAAAPANYAALTASAIAPTPATAYTVGQHNVLADATKAYWTGTAWAAGQAAVAGATSTPPTKAAPPTKAVPPPAPPAPTQHPATKY